MLKRIFVTLLCFQFVACANLNSISTPVQRETASDVGAIKKFCSNLLWKDEYQFKFDQFCAAREKYDGQIITAAHFANWRTMRAEELMALLELHTQQSYKLTKGLELDKLNARKQRRLFDKIRDLQVAEKNVHTRVRKLMSFWYQMTHEETLKRTFKDKVMVRLLFAKIREQDKLARLEGELTSRGAVAVLAEAGMIDDPTWWEIEKRSFQRDHNIVQGVFALAVSGLAVVSGQPMLTMVPQFDFDSATKLANEYENIVAEKGHDEALKQVIEKSQTRTTKNSYYRVIARYANMAMFAAAIVSTAYNHHVEKHEANTAASKVIYGTIETPADTRAAPEKLKSYADEMAADMIRRQEEVDGKLSAAQKAEIYKMFRDNAAAIASETTPKPK